EICFVVESETDPAVAVIRELERDNPQVRCELVIAGRGRRCGQKVHNLMCAARVVMGGGFIASDLSGIGAGGLANDPSCPPFAKGGKLEVVKAWRTGESPPLAPAYEGGERLDPLIPDILAFVDSDACPHVDWLGRLVERIASGKNAVATGYRWYVPQTP